MNNRLRLGVNIDHVATIRNARGGGHPDPVRAAKQAAEAGADGITAHLREDRRHISDSDIERLTAQINLSSQPGDGGDRRDAGHRTASQTARSLSGPKIGRKSRPIFPGGRWTLLRTTRTLHLAPISSPAMSSTPASGFPCSSIRNRCNSMSRRRWAHPLSSFMSAHTAMPTARRPASTN